MIAEWRAMWSAAAPGATHPTAPFGFVTLADGTDEAWGLSMSGLRWAQTANYGVVPNPAMPRVFAALGHDAGDQWDADQCATPLSCCVPTWQPLGPKCLGDHRGEFSYWDTNWFMGQVHPRPKAIIGRRLAQAGHAAIYGGASPPSGPVITGCAVAGARLTLRFNSSGPAAWAASASAANETTALYVLAGARLPADAAANHHGPDWRAYEGPFANGNEADVKGWVAVNAVLAGPASLLVDLAPLRGAAPTAVRYAWGTGGWGAPFLTRMCTGPTVDCSLQPCEVDSCPFSGGGLPAMPFLAEIEGGVCKCLAPQVC